MSPAEAWPRRERRKRKRRRQRKGRSPALLQLRQREPKMWR